jgi:hypothetical protein
MHNNFLKQTIDREDTQLGFSRLKSYQKNLILNASAISSFDTQASKPTEF